MPDKKIAANISGKRMARCLTACIADRLSSENLPVRCSSAKSSTPIIASTHIVGMGGSQVRGRAIGERVSNIGISKRDSAIYKIASSNTLTSRSIAMR